LPASFPPGGSYSASHVRDFGRLPPLISSIKESRSYRNGNFATFEHEPTRRFGSGCYNTLTRPRWSTAPRCRPQWSMGDFQLRPHAAGPRPCRGSPI